MSAGFISVRKRRFSACGFPPPSTTSMITLQQSERCLYNISYPCRAVPIWSLMACGSNLTEKVRRGRIFRFHNGDIGGHSCRRGVPSIYSRRRAWKARKFLGGGTAQVRFLSQHSRYVTCFFFSKLYMPAVVHLLTSLIRGMLFSSISG